MNIDQAYNYYCGRASGVIKEDGELLTSPCTDIEVFMKALNAECERMLCRAQEIDEIIIELPEDSSEHEYLGKLAGTLREHAGLLMSLLASATVTKKLMQTLT